MVNQPRRERDSRKGRVGVARGGKCAGADDVKILRAENAEVAVDHAALGGVGHVGTAGLVVCVAELREKRWIQCEEIVIKLELANSLLFERIAELDSERVKRSEFVVPDLPVEKDAGGVCFSL